MTPLELAHTYMQIVFSGKNVDRLEEILTNDFTFTGPLYEFGSAAEYIDAMREDPLAGARYTITESFENEHAACLIYTFSRPGVTVTMAQTFTMWDGRICRVELLFDPRPFA